MFDEYRDLSSVEISKFYRFNNRLSATQIKQKKKLFNQGFRGQYEICFKAKKTERRNVISMIKLSLLFFESYTREKYPMYYNEFFLGQGIGQLVSTVHHVIATRLESNAEADREIIRLITEIKKQLDIILEQHKHEIKLGNKFKSIAYHAKKNRSLIERIARIMSS